MRILVLAENYPMPDGSVSLMYIHTRNLYYRMLGADVTVINFRAKQCADMNGIRVITMQEYQRHKDSQRYDLLVSHASNIKHHYRFIRKYGSLFPHHVFFFHGHEVLRRSKAYPPLFDWKKRRSMLITAANDLYDSFKLRVWKNYFENRRNMQNTELIFVSQWMLDEFLKNTKVRPEAIAGRSHIIYNSIGMIFENNIYEPEEAEYDFVTVRASIDGEKYCVDVVNKLAKNNPQYKFLVVGRGELFSHIEKAENLEWRNVNMQHEEMIRLFARCRFALMPTRTDAQGLMMCEMATYGIPVITSDIPVCHEALGSFDNVSFISNDGDDDLSVHAERLSGTNPEAGRKNEKYYQKNTSGKEYELFRTLTGK